MSGALARPHHAYLFGGPAHVGKQTAALWFAQGLNCSQRVAEGGCGICSDCEAIARGAHPDVRVWEPLPGEQRVKVESVRELIQAVAPKPFCGAYKVHVLTNVDAMTPAACNALLKTLEEPPGRTVLVLVARDLEEVLPTLLSRCVVVPFSLTTVNAVSEALREAYPDLSGDLRQAIAQRCQGRVGEALRLAREGIGERLPLVFPSPDERWRWAEQFAQLPAAKQEEALDEWLFFLHDRAGGVVQGVGNRSEVMAILEVAEAVEAARLALSQHGSTKLVFDRLARVLVVANGLLARRAH